MARSTPLATCKTVQQRRFSDVRFAHYSNLETVANPLGYTTTFTFYTKRFQGLFQQRDNLWRDIGRNILVSEINNGLKQRHRPDQIGAPLFDQRAEIPLEHPQSLFSLSLGLGLDQITETFDLGEIQTFVFQGASGKFTGLRQP